MADDDGDWLRPLLADLPDPPIPTDVADRITAALRAESAVRAAALSRQGPRHFRRIRSCIVSRGGITGACSPTMPHRDGDVAVAATGPGWWPPAVSPLPGSWQRPSSPRCLGRPRTPASRRIPGFSCVHGQVPPCEHRRGLHPGEPHQPRRPQPARQPRACQSGLSSTTFAATDDGIDSCLAGVGNPAQELAMLDLADYQDAHVAVLAYLKGADDATIDVVVVGEV